MTKLFTQARNLWGLCICFLSLTALAQSPKQHLRIQISYQSGGQHLEQAVETIEAINTIDQASTVEYRAGSAVTLLPGFEAKSGSTFTAQIRPLGSAAEFPLQLAAFPNPFDDVTTIEYMLPADGKVSVWVTDAQGKIVGQLIQDENQTAGKHRVEWKPSAIPSGIYMPVIESNQQRAISRLIKK